LINLDTNDLGRTTKNKIENNNCLKKRKKLDTFIREAERQPPIEGTVGENSGGFGVHTVSDALCFGGRISSGDGPVRFSLVSEFAD
jgi:hypothetical protein